MNINDLKPAYALANDGGVKMVCYGPPGSGKTPVTDTAPRPVMMVVEPGMLSMRGSKIACYDAFTPQRIEEFMAWLQGSAEAKQFDTVCIDSISQLAEIILAHELTICGKDPRQAYGQLSIKVMRIANALYFMKQKHVYLIAKQSNDTDGKKRPYFPGQDLNVKIPHLFDIIAQMDLHNIDGVPTPQKAFRCHAAYDISARDRSGKLNTFEPCNLSNLFAKAMSA